MLSNTLQVVDPQFCLFKILMPAIDELANSIFYVLRRRTHAAFIENKQTAEGHIRVGEDFRSDLCHAGAIPIQPLLFFIVMVETRPLEKMGDRFLSPFEG